MKNQPLEKQWAVKLIEVRGSNNRLEVSLLINDESNGKALGSHRLHTSSSAEIIMALQSTVQSQGFPTHLVTDHSYCFSEIRFVEWAHSKAIYLSRKNAVRLNG